MTDDELVRLCAEKVMGYVEFGADMAYPKVGLVVLIPVRAGGGRYGDGDGLQMIIFNPLEDDADACAVLGMMEGDGWEWNVRAFRPYGGPLERRCNFYQHTGLDTKPRVYSAGGLAHSWDRRRCIVLAALRAKGVEVSDD